MTRRERVKAAIAHQFPDKVPTFFHLASDGLNTYNDRLWERYGTADMRRLHDEGKLGNRNSLYYSMGNHVCFLENFPWWGWRNLPPEYSGWETPDFIPETEEYGSLEVFARSVQNLREAYYSRGIENFLADMAGDPEFAKELLDFITEKNMEKLRQIVAVPGIDGVLLGNDWGSQRDLLMSPESWRTLLKPGAKKEYDMIHEAGMDVWVHSCGDIRKILPDLVEMGVDVLNPIQPECMDIYELKDMYGDKLTFWGGISTQQTLPMGTPEEVRTETLRVTEYMSRNGGYLIAAAQGMQADVPFENLCALVDISNEL